MTRCAHFFFVILLTFSCDVSIKAQTKDPYADDVKKLERKRFIEMENDVVQKVKRVYYALGCSVIDNGSAGALRYFYEMSLIDQIRSGGPNDIKLDDKIRSATEEGLKASKDSGCDYWKDNIEEVAELRREGRLARGN